jgi:putative FmdB family regulatory protein
MIMPIYEYECRSCSHHCQFLQKANEPLKVECPQCKANALQKVISSASFHLKGGGWYVTDFRNPPKSSPSPHDNKETKEDKKAKEAPKEATSTKSPASEAPSGEKN